MTLFWNKWLRSAPMLPKEAKMAFVTSVPFLLLIFGGVCEGRDGPRLAHMGAACSAAVDG